MDEVAIPLEEDKQLLHQVRDDIVQLPGGEGRDVVLATVQDAAALAAPAHDEVVRDVGSSVLNEPVLKVRLLQVLLTWLRILEMFSFHGCKLSLGIRMWECLL